MSCEEMTTPIALAIADLELSKARLLEVFEWAALPRMITDQARNEYMLLITTVRATLPLLDRQLEKALLLLVPQQDGKAERPK